MAGGSGAMVLCSSFGAGRLKNSTGLQEMGCQCSFTDTLPTCREVGTSLNIDLGLEPAVAKNTRKTVILPPGFLYVTDVPVV